MTVIQHLIDRQEITDVVHRLGRWLDNRGRDPATIYSPDVTLNSPRGQTRGIENVLAFARAGHDVSSGERVTHQHTDIVVTIEGDTTRATGHEITRFFRNAEAPWRTSGLWVDYRLRRLAEGWRIATLNIALQWLEGLPLN